MTRENLSTIIRTAMIKSATSLISFLTVIRGHLLSWLLKSANAELSVRTVIGSTQSSNKDTTPSKTSSEPLDSLPPVTNSSCNQEMTYTDPNSFLHDIQRGVLPLRAVTMEQFLLAHSWIAVDNNSPQIRKHVMINGNLYDVRMQIASVKYPEEGNNLVGARQ